MRKALSIIEVMFALTLIAVLMAATSPVLLTSMRSNGDSRIREQAVAATEGWLDRFRAQTLTFENFLSSPVYEFGYDYANDPAFVAAGDPSPEALNAEWQPFQFQVTTTKYSTTPRLIWQVAVKTNYHTKIDGGGDTDADFEIATLISQ